MDEENCFDNVDVLKGSFAPKDWGLIHLHETMAEIIMECTWVQTWSCAVMQHQLFEELDQSFTTFVWLQLTNPFTWKWYFIGWMMVSGTPSTR
jgi:hypothetical protein